MAWICLVLALQSLAMPWVLAACVAGAVLAEIHARQRWRTLIRRSRWLLVALLAFFLLATPGEYLSGWAGSGLGVSYEGLRQSAEHCGRLLALLASLAILHERLGTRGLLVALHRAMGCLPGRDKTVVRLALVIESIEENRVRAWRDWLHPHDEIECAEAILRLDLPSFGWRDHALFVLLGLLAFAWATAS